MKAQSENPLSDFMTAPGMEKCPLTLEQAAVMCGWFAKQIAAAVDQQTVSSGIRAEWATESGVAKVYGYSTERMRNYIAEGVRLGKISILEPLDRMKKVGRKRYNLQDVADYMESCNVYKKVKK